MIGKYEFSKENIEKVFLFFEPFFYAISPALDNLYESLQDESINLKDLEKLMDEYENLEFFDEFQEIQEKWADIKEKIELSIVSKQVAENEPRPYFAFSYLYECDTLINRIHHYIISSFDNLKNNKDIWTLEDIKLDLAANLEVDIKNIILNIECLNKAKEPIIEKLNLIDVSLPVENIIKNDQKVIDLLTEFVTVNQQQTVELEQIWLNNDLKAAFFFISNLSAIVTLLAFIDDYEKNNDDLDE